MIPDELIRKAARAIHARSIYRSEPWEEAPRWHRLGTEFDARVALEAVAADIWDEGHNTRRTVERGGWYLNPYRASETA